MGAKKSRITSKRTRVQNALLEHLYCADKMKINGDIGSFYSPSKVTNTAFIFKTCKTPNTRAYQPKLYEYDELRSKRASTTTNTNIGSGCKMDAMCVTFCIQSSENDQSEE